MTLSEAELKSLMLVGLKGDAVAHRTLLNHLSGRLRAYYKGKLARIGRGATEAEDLVQEALIAIHMRRHTHDPAEPLTPWVYAIARYKLIDHLRRTRASQANVPLDAAEEVLAHDDHVAVESSHDLQKLLARLPDKTRRAIQATRLDGLTVTETANRYGLTESAVKVSVHRGLKALAGLIAREKKA